MNGSLIYPALLVILGVLLSTTAIVFLYRFSNKILEFFQLYPESKGVLKISLRFISWFIGLIIFLVFLRTALGMVGVELAFTTMVVEDIIKIAPRYIVAMLIILAGAYVSRAIREKSKGYDFEFKNYLMLAIDFVVYLTFALTALYSIGIKITVFLEVYKVILWVFGAVIALIISMVIGIPIGISIYHKMHNKTKPHKSRGLPKEKRS